MQKYFAFIVSLVLVPAVGFAQTTHHFSIHSGTGFFVNQSYLVTNAHVVNGCSKVDIQGPVPAQEAWVDSLDTEHDLALIKTSAASPKVAPMRSDINTLQPGTKLYILGYPGLAGVQGKYKFVQAEIPSLPANMPGTPGRFYLSDSVDHGNSGGPVFDLYGNIVGVVVAKTTFYSTNRNTGEKTPVQQLGIAIDLNTLNQFLSAHSVYTSWGGSGSLTVDPYIEENAKAYIVNIQCHK